MNGLDVVEGVRARREETIVVGRRVADGLEDEDLGQRRVETSIVGTKDRKERSFVAD